MSNQTIFQEKNKRLNANNTDLSSILETINNLPEASSGGGKLITGGILYAPDGSSSLINAPIESGKTYNVKFYSNLSGGETNYEYNCTSYEIAAAPGFQFLGNASIIGLGANTGEHFFIIPKEVEGMNMDMIFFNPSVLSSNTAIIQIEEV